MEMGRGREREKEKQEGIEGRKESWFRNPPEWMEALCWHRTSGPMTFKG